MVESVEQKQPVLNFHHALELWRWGELHGRGENTPRILEVTDHLYADIPLATHPLFVTGADDYCGVCDRNPEGIFFDPDTSRGPCVVDAEATAIELEAGNALAFYLRKPSEQITLEDLLGAHRIWLRQNYEVSAI